MTLYWKRILGKFPLFVIFVELNINANHDERMDAHKPNRGSFIWLLIVCSISGLEVGMVNLLSRIIWLGSGSQCWVALGS